MRSRPLSTARWRRRTRGRPWPHLPQELEVLRRDIPHYQYRSLAYTLIDDLLWIVAVVHERQRPGYWIDRLGALPRQE